jgi:hypothetical protein
MDRAGRKRGQLGSAAAGTLDAAGAGSAAAPEKTDVPEAGAPLTEDRTDAADAPEAEMAAPGADVTETTGTAGGPPGPRRGLAAFAARPVVTHLAVLAVYLAAGIALTWPRATYITGRLPETRDVAAFVWDLWWVAHQVVHLATPWSTHAMAAPVGVQLGFSTTMPLLGVVFTPVTVAFGPSFTFSLLTILMPGLLCYAMYRCARLWLRSQTGAIAAGAFFGLSSMLAEQDWAHLNIVAGTVFLPLTVEAAVRLRRRPGRRPALILGVVLGACVLVNQESAVMAGILAVAILAPWLLRRPRACPEVPARSGSGHPAPGWQGGGGAHSGAMGDDDNAASRDAGAREPGRGLGGGSRWVKVTAVGVGLLTALVVGSPQLAAMAEQVHSGGASVDPHLLAVTAKHYGQGLDTLFSPAQRVAYYGLHNLAAWSPTSEHVGATAEGMPMFGTVLCVLALAGLIVSWRRRSAWLLAALLVGSAWLSLGASLWWRQRQFVPFEQLWHGVRVSPVMPYTWLMRIPLLSAFREADRLAILGLVAAALLAGAAVEWLRYHARPLIVVVAAAALLESGYAALPSIRAMPTTLPALDGPIAADHSGSIVVDFPFGLRGGIPEYGRPFSPRALLIATADGHPRLIAYTSWVPARTRAQIAAHPFYAALEKVQHGIPLAPLKNAAGNQVTAEQVAAARADARKLGVGWVLVWTTQNPVIKPFLDATGFRLSYRADGVMVYRPVTPPGAGS